MAFGALLQDVSTTASTTNATLAVTFGNNVTSGSLIVARFCGAAAATWGVTDSLSNTYTQVIETANSNGNDLNMWYTVSTSSGACTVTATRTGGSNIYGLIASEYDGPFAVSPNNGSSSAIGTSGTSSSGDVTPTRNGCLLVSYLEVAAVPTAEAGWTTEESFASDSGTRIMAASKIQGALATEDFDATHTSSVWVSGLIAFAPTGVSITVDAGSYTITGTATTLSKSTTAGYIFRIDTGTTFDSASITSYVTLPWTQAPNPQSHDKTVQWLDLTAYLKGTATVNVDARFANEPHEFSTATFTTYGTIGATPDGDKGFVYLGVTSRWMQIRLRATALGFEVQPPIVVGFNSTGRRV